MGKLGGDVADWIHPLLQPKTGTTKRRGRNQSSWVGRYGYALLNDGRQGLVIMYNDGTTCFYDAENGYNERIWAEMHASPSKGQFVWQVLMPQAWGNNSNYEIIEI
jgi:hypothetical protein